MSQPYVGEIKMFAGNFAPRGYSFCDGQLLAVSQNDALFSLLGTIYGGDGRTTFGLPDMRGRLPVHAGAGPGLSPRRLGVKEGTETESITAAQTPVHRHDMVASTGAADIDYALGNVLADTGMQKSYNASTPDAALAVATSETSGGSQPHDNMMPFLCVNFIIALVGVYPSRT